MTRRRDFNALIAAQVGASQGAGVLDHLNRRTGRYYLAAVHAGARADVEHVVGGTDRLLVVFNHHHGVAEIAQVLEGPEQAGVVACVQADGGLIEHVQHAGQPGADLGGQTNALGFATGQGFSCPRHGQVFETDINQEAKP